MKNITLNFGAIRDTVYRFATKQIISEGKEKETVLSKFLKSIKDNPIFKIQYFIYKNLEEGKCVDHRLADRYIAQNLKLLGNYPWETILESNKKIRLDILGTSYVQGDGGKDDLYENINTLIESSSRKGMFDIEKAEASHEYISNHLIENYKNAIEKQKNQKELETDDYPSMLSLKFITNLAVNNFNKRYSHLNENEKKLLKVLLSSDDKKINYLKDLKNESLDQIDRVLNSDIEEESEKILINFKEKIIGLSESENVDDAIIHCYELKETLEELSK